MSSSICDSDPSWARIAPGEIAEVIDRQRDVGVQRLADRLAVVPGFGDRDRLQVLLDPVGDLVQDHRPLGRRRLAPRGCRGVRGVQRLLDIGLVRPRHLAERLAGYRDSRFSKYWPVGRGPPTHRRCSCRSGAGRTSTIPRHPVGRTQSWRFSCLQTTKMCRSSLKVGCKGLQHGCTTMQPTIGYDRSKSSPAR